MAEDKYELRANQRGSSNIDYAFPKEGDEWSVDYFHNTYSDASNLAKLDVSTNEGLGELQKILKDPSVKKLDSNKATKVHKNLVEMVQAGMAENSMKNISGLAGVLDNQTAFGLDLSFPGFYTSSSGDTYVATVKAINLAQDVASDIKNDPQAYLEKRFEGLNDDSKAYWSTLSQEILEADQNISQSEAFDAIQAYGSAQKYLAENITTGNNLAKEFREKQGELQKEVQEAFQARFQEKGGYLTAQEEIDLKDSFKDKQEELLEKYRQGARASQVVPKMLGNVMQATDETIIAKKKEEAEKARK